MGIYAPYKPGQVLQMLGNTSAGTTSSTVIIPLDNTIPQITEGFEILTQAITPSNANNTLFIHANAFAGINASGGITMALFQDSTANALYATTHYQLQSAGDLAISLMHTMTAGTTSATTFRIRIGANGNTATLRNGRFSTTPGCFISVTEVAV